MEDNFVTVRTIRNVSEYVKKPNFDEQSYEQVLSRKNHLAAAWKGLITTFQAEIGKTEGEAKAQLHAIYDELEALYLDTTAVLKARMDELRPPPVEPPVRAIDPERRAIGEGGNEEEIPLGQRLPEEQPEQEPEQQLPNLGQPVILQYRNPGQMENTWGTFSGEFTSWKSFHDKFKASVHEQQIANVFKMQLLLSSLKGQAARAFGDWQITDENYLEAWARLKQLYSRPYQASKELLWKFHNLPKLEHATGGILQKFSNVTHEVIRSLRAMQYNVDHLDVFFVHGIHDRLDSETSKEWELHRASETPTIYEMLDFLDRQAKALSGAKYVDKKSTNESKKRNSNNFERNDNKRARFDDSKKSEVKFEHQGGCWLCKENHPLTRCPQLKGFSFYDRKKYIREQQLCNNCFKPNHRAVQCLAGPCIRCNLKHNSLLCPENPNNKTTVTPVQVKKSIKPKSENKFTKKRA